MRSTRARLLGTAAVVTGVTAIAVALLTLGLAPREPGGLPAVLSLVPVALGFGGVGALLLARRPESPVGWLMAGVGLLESSSSLAGTAAGEALAAGGVRAAATLSLAGQVLQVFTILGLVVLLPALFPTGRVATPRWRWLPSTAFGFAVLHGACLVLLPEVGVAGTALVNPYGLTSTAAVVEVLAAVGFIGTLLLALPAVGSLVVRFRASAGVERLQLRWFVLSIVWLATSGVGLILWATAWNLGLLPNPSNLLFDSVITLGITTVPVAIGAAVLRYRLYDIDRLVSRTVSWAVVTVVLVVLYLGGVVVLQMALRPLLGEGDVPVALGTLAAAATARPLLVRVRAGVDRRFNRARYDAALTVEAFGRGVRDQVGLDEITADLRAAASATVQPGVIGVLLVAGDQP